MATATDNLPDDIEVLKALVLKYRDEALSLREQLNLLIAKRFGPSSEKVDQRQLGLFNEAKDAEPRTIPTHTRNKPGRQPLPDYIEREEVLHNLPEAEKICSHDGTVLERIGEDISEQLDVIPAKVRVQRYIRPKYACPCCRQGITTAAMLPQPIPKSLASLGMLAHVCTARHCRSIGRRISCSGPASRSPAQR